MEAWAGRNCTLWRRLTGGIWGRGGRLGLIAVGRFWAGRTIFGLVGDPFAHMGADQPLDFDPLRLRCWARIDEVNGVLLPPGSDTFSRRHEGFVFFFFCFAFFHR